MDVKIISIKPLKKFVVTFFSDPLISKSVLIPNKLRNTFVSKGEGSHQKYIKQQYPYSLGYVFSKGPFTII